MATPRELYDLWSRHPYFDAATPAELATIAGDPLEIGDRCYQRLEFGTAGLRGLIGAGTNRINRYTVRHATQGLAGYIGTFGETARQRGVVIAHDPRHGSPEFALEAALTLNAAGIVAYLWESLRPTPLLSFAVRELKATAGIVITASHNPPAYNGYKVYWEDGGQVPPEKASAIHSAIAAISDITAIQPLEVGEARDRKLLRPVPPTVDRAYSDRLLELVTTAPDERNARKVASHSLQSPATPESCWRSPICGRVKTVVVQKAVSRRIC